MENTAKIQSEQIARLKKPLKTLLESKHEFNGSFYGEEENNQKEEEDEDETNGSKHYTDYLENSSLDEYGQNNDTTVPEQEEVDDPIDDSI